MIAYVDGEMQVKLFNMFGERGLRGTNSRNRSRLKEEKEDAKEKEKARWLVCNFKRQSR